MFVGMYEEMRCAYAAAGELFELHLDLLSQCDLDCHHCYLDDKSHTMLPTGFWKDVLEQAAELGVASVTLSGGEVTLRRDLLELVARARALGLFVHLKSHGGRIDEAYALRLADLGLSSASLSYYAADAEVHDRITRRPGSHGRTRAALRHLSAAGIPTIAACVVMRENRQGVHELAADCRELGVYLRLDDKLQLAHSGDDFPHGFELTGERRVEWEMSRPDAAGSSRVRQQRDSDDAKNCAAGHLALYIGPEGDVRPCVSWPMSLGNLRAGESLRSVWESSPGLCAVRALRKRDRKLCLSCEVRGECDFCAGQAWRATGDPMAATRAQCERTYSKLRARARSTGASPPPVPAGLLVSGRPDTPDLVQLRSRRRSCQSC